MTNKDLVEKRFYPAIEEMYMKSDTVFPKDELPSDFDYSFKNLCRYAPFMDDEKKRRQFPIEFFYLPNEEYQAISKKAVKGLRSYYVFPYRSEIIYSDDEIKDMERKIKEYTETDPEKYKWDIQDISKKVEWNDEHKRRDQLWKEYFAEYNSIQDKFDKKEIDRKQYNVEKKALYKKYDCTKRCRDAEAISFELMDYGPNSSEEFFIAVKHAYNGEPYESKVKDRVENAAKLAHEFVNNIKNNTPTWDGKEY